MRRRLQTVLAAALVLAALPGAALAQEEMEDQAAQHPTAYADSETGWAAHRIHVSGFGGRLTGGTSLGFSQNLFFSAQFEQGSDSTWGGRVGWVFAPRFDVEIEYGRSSPGLDAVLTDLQGQGRTVADFADLDLNWLVGAVNYSVVERTRRIAPYLTLGVGRLGVSSSEESSIDTSEIVLAYGAGVRVRAVDRLAIRADVRGLRSGLGGKQTDTDSVPDVLLGKFNGTNLVWTVGLEISF